MTSANPLGFSLEPNRDKKLLRRQLQAERQSMVDRHQRAVHLQEVWPPGAPPSGANFRVR